MSAIPETAEGGIKARLKMPIVFAAGVGTKLT
jgi:hypothetical protein